MIYVFTDGGCLDNGKPTAEASWAVVLTRDINQTENYFQMSGYVDGDTSVASVGDTNAVTEHREMTTIPQTNNRGELTAIWQALQHIKKYYSNEHVTICADSMYCLNIIQKWGRGWIDNGTEKKNMDLVRKIIKLSERLKTTVSYRYVRGHCEDGSGFSIYNGIVDKCCTELLKNKIKK